MNEWTLRADGALTVQDPKNGRTYAIRKDAAGFAIDASSSDGRSTATIDVLPHKSQALLSVMDRLKGSAARLTLVKSL